MDKPESNKYELENHRPTPLEMMRDVVLSLLASLVSSSPHSIPSLSPSNVIVTREKPLGEEECSRSSSHFFMKPQ